MSRGVSVPGKEISEGNFHGLGDLGQGLERWNGVAVFDARKIAAEQAGAALNVTLRKAALAAIGFDDFADVYLWFLFRHGSSNGNSSLVANSRSGKGERMTKCS